jgi:hypothetical protein
VTPGVVVGRKVSEVNAAFIFMVEEKPRIEKIDFSTAKGCGQTCFDQDFV